MIDLGELFVWSGERERKYERDSKEVVKSTVFTFTPSRAFNGAGAKFRIAFTPAAITWLRTRWAARAGTAITATSIASSRTTFAIRFTSKTAIPLRVRSPIFEVSL